MRVVMTKSHDVYNAGESIVLPHRTAKEYIEKGLAVAADGPTPAPPGEPIRRETIQPTLPHGPTPGRGAPPTRPGIPAGAPTPREAPKPAKGARR